MYTKAFNRTIFIATLGLMLAILFSLPAFAADYSFKASTDQPHFEYYSSAPASVIENDADGKTVVAHQLLVVNWPLGTVTNYSNTSWRYGQYNDYYFSYENRPKNETIFVEGEYEWIKAEWLHWGYSIYALYYEIWPDGRVWWKQCGGAGVDSDTQSSCHRLQLANAKILAIIKTSGWIRQDVSYYRWKSDPHWENTTVDKWDLYRVENSGFGYQPVKEGWNFINGTGTDAYFPADGSDATGLVTSPFVFPSGSETKTNSNSSSASSALPLAVAGVIGTVAVAGVYIAVRTGYGRFLLKTGATMMNSIGTGGGFVGSENVRQEKGSIIDFKSSPFGEQNEIKPVSISLVDPEMGLVRIYGESYNTSAIDMVENLISYYQTRERILGTRMTISEAQKLAARLNYEEENVRKAYEPYIGWQTHPNPSLALEKSKEWSGIKNRISNLKDELVYATGIEKRPDDIDKLGNIPFIGTLFGIISNSRDLDISIKQQKWDYALRDTRNIIIAVASTLFSSYIGVLNTILNYSNPEQRPGERYFGNVMPQKVDLGTYTTGATNNTLDLSVLWSINNQKYINTNVTYAPENETGLWLNVANAGLWKTASRIEVLSVLERFSVSDFYTTAEKWTGPSARDATKDYTRADGYVMYDTPTKSTYPRDMPISPSDRQSPVSKSTYPSTSTVSSTAARSYYSKGTLGGPRNRNI
ncbi:MAG: hypothetical protein HY362_02475 [Candidatus Aenigmarchaeota archaeon]|nr:hypothetical protein [Candidatus Aenigmarchaeota archaeon]